ncbi:MAG: hypothetical protein ACRD50_12590 [Candidatus Acidiferrales bacterium]
MNDDYLWDRSGTPDREIARLENLLGRFGHSGRAMDFENIPAAEIAPKRRAWLVWLVPVTATACLIFWLALRFYPSPPGWLLTSVSGDVSVAGKVVTTGSRIRPGDWLETRESGRATLAVDGYGDVEVKPGTRVSLVKASSSAEQLRLAYGTIHAEINAPPQVFLTYMSSAYALDMGCAYTLHANPDGTGMIEVTSGWVQFQHGWNQSMVPAGAMAETRPGIGPGAPYSADASARFREALATLNFNTEGTRARAEALSTILEEARPRDAFTLLNLFKRVEPDERGRIYDRLVKLAPPPAGASRAGAIDLDPRTLDPWWDALGIGHVKKGTKKIPRIVE